MNPAIPLAKPDITDAERTAVANVLDSSVLSIGPYIERFEQQLADLTGMQYGVAVNSGTSALHLAMLAADIGKRDYVITTPFTFVASANCILMVDAKPIFADVDPLSWNISPSAIDDAIGKLPDPDRVKAMIPVHIFGTPCDMPALWRIARDYRLQIIEDSCEALGARVNGEHVGKHAFASVLAFYGNKITTNFGEGGWLGTNSPIVDKLCRSLRNQGRDEPAWLVHNRLGYNYRMTEVQAAFGEVQVRRLPDIMAARQRVASAYLDRLSQEDRISFQTVEPGTERSWFVFVVKLDDRFSQEDRDGIIQDLRASGIGAAPYFMPLHLQPLYRDMGFRPGDFPVAERVGSRTLALPFFNSMTESQIDQVVERFTALLDARTPRTTQHRVTGSWSSPRPTQPSSARI